MKNVEKFKRKKLVSNSYVTLCRYGGINKMIKQKGNYDAKEEYDSKYRAPERKGFYAFIYPFVDKSLLDGVANSGKTRLHEHKKGKTFFKKFKVIDGLIWTHLKPKNYDLILAQKGAWFKVRVSDFIKILKQEVADSSGFAGSYISDEQKTGLTVKNPYINFNRSDLEVFVCKDSVIS